MAGAGRRRGPVPPRGGGSRRYRQGVTCGRLPPAADTLRRTPLFDRHEQAGARLVPFAGWEMPVQYEGIRQEHVAVRTSAGMFDVSHMGEIETSGPQAEALLQRLLSNDVTKIAEHGAQYSVLCREDGGVLDDLFTYRLGPERFLTVTNASNHEKDLAWFREHSGDFDAEVVRRARALGDARRAGTRRPRGSGAPGRGRASGADADGGRVHRWSRVPRLRHGLYRRGRRGASDPAGRRPEGLGRAARAGRGAGGSGGSRHAPARGLFPPLWK